MCRVKCETSGDNLVVWLRHCSLNYWCPLKRIPILRVLDFWLRAEFQMATHSCDACFVPRWLSNRHRSSSWSTSRPICWIPHLALCPVYSRAVLIIQFSRVDLRVVTLEFGPWGNVLCCWTDIVNVVMQSCNVSLRF